jgi:hypothetical protein
VELGEGEGEKGSPSKTNCFFLRGRSLFLKGLNHPFGLAIHGDFMYWTDLLDGIVRSINKTSGEITILADCVGY